MIINIKKDNNLMMVIRFVCVFFILSISSAVFASDIYRCNVNGKTVFTDEPCNGEQVILSPMNVLSSSEGSSAGAGLSSYNSSRWYYDISGYKKALKISKRYDVPIFIYFQADWCGYCRKLESNLLHKRNAQRSLKQVVKVQISPENGVKENALFRQLGATGYPTVFTMTNSATKPIKRRLARNKNGVWKAMPIDEFANFISSL